MASLSISSIADVFPATTSVGAYPASGWSQAALPPAGAPPVSATASGTVASDGSLAISGLADGTLYYLAASISGTWRYRRSRTTDSTATSSITPTAVKTANYSTGAGELVPVDCSGGPVTITLPSAPADKTRVTVKLIAVSGANVCTIARGGSDVFNKAGGSTSLSLSLLNQAATLQYEAATGIWYVQSTDAPIAALDTRYLQTTLTFTTQTASYTLVLADGNTLVEVTSSSAATVTVPPNSSVAFPVGTVIEIARGGTGTVAIAAGAGVTLRSRSSLLTIGDQYSTVSLRKRATDEWWLDGNLA